MWLHSLKVAQLLRSAACLRTNQSRSYLNHLVHSPYYTTSVNVSKYCIGSTEISCILIQLLKVYNKHVIRMINLSTDWQFMIVQLAFSYKPLQSWWQLKMNRNLQPFCRKTCYCFHNKYSRVDYFNDDIIELLDSALK